MLICISAISQQMEPGGSHRNTIRISILYIIGDVPCHPAQDFKFTYLNVHNVNMKLVM
jgi:hypothetical protein